MIAILLKNLGPILLCLAILTGGAWMFRMGGNRQELRAAEQALEDRAQADAEKARLQKKANENSKVLRDQIGRLQKELDALIQENPSHCDLNPVVSEALRAAIEEANKLIGVAK